MAINLFWCSLNRNDGKENFGDLLSEYIVKKISKRNIKRVLHPSMRRYKYLIRHYLTVGSILEVANKNSIVWGSGIIRRNDFIKKATFLAVRGPITRKRLLEIGYDVPELYGDPAILLPKFYSKLPQKEFKLGLIPHYVDYKWTCENFKESKDVKIVDMLTNDIENVLQEILKCEFIISSSLHGVIVPHSYGIPALWVKFSDKLGGDNIKFYDYLESVNINYESELSIQIENFNLDYLLNLFNENKSIVLPSKGVILKREKDLLESNPF